MSSAPIFRYPGKDADVTWDQRLCIHIGECGRAQGDLFVTGRKPWCRPWTYASGARAVRSSTR